jgi:hypothetical protein
MHLRDCPSAARRQSKRWSPALTCFCFLSDVSGNFVRARVSVVSMACDEEETASFRVATRDQGREMLHSRAALSRFAGSIGACHDGKRRWWRWLYVVLTLLALNFGPFAVLLDAQFERKGESNYRVAGSHLVPAGRSLLVLLLPSLFRRTRRPPQSPA